MLGVAAATALPSEVWPFRKIFLPPAPKIWMGVDFGFDSGVAIATFYDPMRVDILDFSKWGMCYLEWDSNTESWVDPDLRRITRVDDIRKEITLESPAWRPLS
jgi:hypothetical protein